MHPSDVLSNLTTPVRNLFERLRDGEFVKLLAAAPRPTSPTKQGRQRRLSPTAVDQLVREYCNGAGSVYDLAERYGVHRNTIAKHLRDRGFELGRLPLTDKEIEGIRELRAKGLSLNAIGRAIGRDPKTVKGALDSN